MIAPRQPDNAPRKPSRRRRGLKRLAVVAAILLLLIIVPLAVILYPALKSYPTSDFAAADTALDRSLQDLAHLRRLTEVERSFTDETRSAFEEAVAAMEQRAGGLDTAGLAMAAAKAVALADNGHTNVLGIAGDYGFNAVPIRFGWFADGLFVVATDDAQRDLLGGQVLTVNGRTTAELVEALRPYMGGPANLAREFVPNFLVSPELLHAAGLGEAASASVYELRFTDGRIGSVELAAEPARHEPQRGFLWPKRNLSPIAQDPPPAGWRHVLDGLTLPAYLSRPDVNYWHDYPAPDLLYVQINRVSDQTPVGLSQYLSEMLNEAETRSVQNVIVDLRFNGGGNYVLAADFARRLPTVLPSTGKLYVLTSANTFSAAISTAARLKYFAGGRAVLVGEPVGDRLQHWGEGGVTVLPNSNIPIRYTTAYHDWEKGCGLAEITRCFLLNYLYAVSAGDLQPVVPIAPTFTDYAAGKDVAVIEVMALIEADRKDQ